VQGQIDLVLRPGEVPSGLDMAAVEMAIIPGIKEDHGLYQVSYSGPAGKVWLGAGYINSPPALSTQTVDVRGNEATLYQTVEGDQTWLYWHEDGIGTPTFFYFIRGTISEDDILKIARSLEPYP
jgi:hypothetical protein